LENQSSISSPCNGEDYPWKNECEKNNECGKKYVIHVGFSLLGVAVSGCVILVFTCYVYDTGTGADIVPPPIRYIFQSIILRNRNFTKLKPVACDTQFHTGVILIIG